MTRKRSKAATIRPHIVILAGGTASRNLTIVLIRQGIKVTRLVPRERVPAGGRSS